MPQTLFALLAVMILGIFSLQMNRTIFAGEQKMILNEVATLATGVGTELLEEIGSKNYSFGIANQVFHEGQRDSLYAKGNFCNGPCLCDPDVNFAGCDFITSFDGKKATRERGGILFEVDFEVNYVQENDPSVISGTPTFVARVDLRITSPLLYVGSPDNPLEYKMSRVFTHPRVTG